MQSSSSELESNLLKARVRLWRARGRRTRELGTALLGVSLLMFMLAYLTSYLLFEVTSILSLFLGMVSIFMSIESYVKSEPANMIAMSPLLSLSVLMKEIGVFGNPVYFYDEHGQPRMVLGRNEPRRKVGGSTGRALYPIGNDLVGLYERELGELRDKGIDYLAEWLPRVIVDGLKLASKVEFIMDARIKNSVSVSIMKPAFEMLCSSQELREGKTDKMGCPVTGSIAQAIARGTGMKVSFDGCTHNMATRTSIATFTLYRNSQKF